MYSMDGEGFSDDYVLEEILCDSHAGIDVMTTTENGGLEKVNLKRQAERALNAKATTEAKTEAKASREEWKPKFDQTEWDIANGLKDFMAGEDIDSTTRYAFASKKGRDVFIIYSTENAEDPTLLYGVSGESARALKDYAKRFVRGEYHGIDEARRDIDGYIKSLKHSGKNSTSDSWQSEDGEAENKNVEVSERGTGEETDGRGDFGQSDRDNSELIELKNTLANGKAMYSREPVSDVPLSERVSGDDLYNAEDLIEEVKGVGAEVDKNGYITVYHRTSEYAAKQIEKSGVMTAKEDGLFFSTKRDGQNVGYGDSVIELKIPAEKLILDDIFDDEAHVRIPLGRNRKANVSEYIVKSESAEAETRASREVDGKKIAWVENSKLSSKELGNSNAVAEFIAEHIGEYYTIFESGQKVFVGEDLPKEYVYSKYSDYLKKRKPSLFKAKNRASNELGDMIEIATNRRWEKARHPENKDAKYGLYRYDTAFAFPIRSNRGEITTVKSFDAELVIRNASDGKKYLYDIVNINENTADAKSLFDKELGRKAAMKAALHSGVSNDSIRIAETESQEKFSREADDNYSKIYQQNKRLKKQVEYWKQQKRQTRFFACQKRQR